MTQININGNAKKRCAFCKHWYDPTNSAIRPLNPNVGLWEYERDKDNFCAIAKAKRHAWVSCPKFEFKL